MKRCLAVLLCVVCMLGLSGCISQDEYDAVVAQKNDLDAKVAELQKEYAELLNKNTELDEQLKESQKQVEELTAANEKLKTENDTIKTALEEAKNSKGTLSGLWDSIMGSFDDNE